VRVGIVGNGAFGSALAIVYAGRGHDVAIWGHDSVYTAAIAATRRNPRYLPEAVELPPAIRITSDGAAALAGAECVIVAVPTQHVRDVLTELRAHLPRAVPLISVCKGLEQRSSLRPSAVIREVVGEGHPILVLSGPSHAEEVAIGLPAALVLAGPDEKIVAAQQGALRGSSLRVYLQSDLLGVELCGALKNVIALAAGMAEGLGYGDNAKAAILARGIVEMARYGVAEGADLRTFYGIAGIGDLAVTAFSRHGRNRAFGERIGRGDSLDVALAATRKVAEGVWTSRVVRARARELGIEMPITEMVCAILFEGMAPATAVRSLMERDSKDERLP
jgi:glycerol-3-phosphate dehydrogenase (NAD(P)+)